MSTLYDAFLQQLRATPQENKLKAAPVFNDDDANSIFHQKNTIRLNKIEHGRIVMAVAECERASEHLQSAIAALKGFEGIDASQLWMAANFNHAYVYMLNEFLYQNSVRPAPVAKRHDVNIKAAAL